jgi:hypothetical protein
MTDFQDRIAPRQRAWTAAISLAAGAAIRDHGAAAFVVAQDNVRQSRDLGLTEGARFWMAVSETIVARIESDETIGEPPPKG